MNKISIGGTILRGYGFAAGRIVASVGLSWLAAVFYAVAAAYWMQRFCSTMLVSPHPGSELNDFALFDLFGFVVTSAAGSAIIARALTGAALEPGGETMTAYFAIAKREWILFLATLRLYALVIAALFAVVLLGGFAIAMALPVIGANAHWQGVSALSVMDAAVGVVAFAAIATLAVRLGFFAAPIASGERSMSLVRAWSLSRGNSWRVFAVVMALSVPVLLWFVAMYALVGSDFTGALTAALSPSHDSTTIYQLTAANAPAIAGLWTLLVVVLNMLFAGASASAYLAVRDNITAPRSRESAPILEPAFAGSFAGFAPRSAKAPAASEAENFPQPEIPVESSTAVSAPQSETPGKTADMPAGMSAMEVEPVDAQVTEASAIEMPAAEPELVGPSAEEQAHSLETVEVPAAPSHVEAALAPQEGDAAHQAALRADDVFPPSLAESVEATHPDASGENAEAAEQHTEASEIIPPPSHDGGPELSQQNAPSEAA